MSPLLHPSEIVLWSFHIASKMNLFLTLLALTGAAFAADCHTEKPFAQECVTYYGGGGCNNPVGSYRPTCEGNCFVAVRFLPPQLDHIISDRIVCRILTVLIHKAGDSRPPNAMHTPTRNARMKSSTLVPRDPGPATRLLGRRA